MWRDNYNQQMLITRLIVVAIGLALLSVPSIVPIKIGLLDISAELANIGLFAVTIIIIQISLDEKSRKSLVDYSISSALDLNSSILKGVREIKDDSRTMNTKLIMNDDGKVSIGFNYSSSLYDRLEPLIIERCKSKKKTEICLINPTGKCIDYILSSQDKKSYAITNVEKIVSDLRKLQDKYKNTISIKYHDTPIKYGFISCKKVTGVILYSNDPDSDKVVSLIIEKSDIDVHSTIRNDVEGFVSKCQTI